MPKCVSDETLEKSFEHHLLKYLHPFFPFSCVVRCKVAIVSIFIFNRNEHDMHLNEININFLS